MDNHYYDILINGDDDITPPKNSLDGPIKTGTFPGAFIVERNNNKHNDTNDKK